MSDTETAAPAPGRAAAGSLRAVAALICAAAARNKGLVAGVFGLAALEAFLTKAPIMLLKPLTEALMPGDSAHHWFTVWFEDLAVDIRSLLGLEFTGTPDAVRAMTLCLACAVVAALLGLLGAGAIYGTLLLSRYFAAKVVVDLRNRIAAHMLQLPLGFYGRRRLGDLISNITNDTTVLARSFELAADHVIVDPLLVLGNMLLIAVCVPEAVWLLVVMVPIMALPLVRMGKKVHRSSSKSLAAMGDATESMNQMLSGIKTVKAFQLEEERMREFAGSNALYLRRTRRLLRAKAVSQALVFAGYQLGFAAMLLGAGWLVLSERHEFSSLVVAVAALATTYTHVKRLARAYNTLNESGGALERVQGILDEQPDSGTARGGTVVERIRGDVAFEHVVFAYGREAVLRGLTFTVSAGQTVALVGPSGAGKTTTLDLLARFYDPTAGRILVDGCDLRQLDLRSYRRQLAIVSQQPFLFNATIRDNIRCGRPGAADDQIVEAARVAQIHDFVAGLPDGYDTRVGERGSALSGGQLQRVTIARALLRDPAILILDEATASLDAESEGAVQTALQNLMRGRTCFVIAHRLATVANADVILVMEQGRVAERGTHAQLVERDGLYFRLRQLQQLM